MAIIQLAIATRPSTSPAMAIPLPLRLGALLVWFSPIIPKITARIAKGLMKKPNIPVMSAVIAIPLVLSPAALGAGAGAGAGAATWVRAAPHLLQNLLSSGFSSPHLEQNMSAFHLLVIGKKFFRMDLHWLVAHIVTVFLLRVNRVGEEIKKRGIEFFFSGVLRPIPTRPI